MQTSRLGRDATLQSFTAGLGGRYARVRTDSALVGQAGRTSLLAAYLGTGEQVHDFRTLQDHDAPRTESQLLFKGAVADTARSVYSGLIQIRKGARGSNAMQTNHNLVLSEGAHADSVPNLDIDENDVRCSHASTVGPIDEEQRYYLETRGIAPAVAERLIVLGFFSDLAGRAPFPGVGRWVEDAVQPPHGGPLVGLGGLRWVIWCGCADATSSRSGEARRFDVGAHRIALVRIEDDFYAIGDECSHEDYSLSEGEVLVEACEIECWKHGSMFDLQNRRTEIVAGHQARSRIRRPGRG